jgi:SH3-like domain-containing protein
MSVTRPLVACLLSLACGAAHAVDFKTVGENAVILYDTPSPKGGKLFIAPSGMPVEVLLSYGDWVKVRDAAGDMAWTESKGLSPRRNVIVRAPSTRMRAGPDEAAATLMIVERHVLLELVDPVPGPWLRVRHRDGVSGYVRASDVWGI